MVIDLAVTIEYVVRYGGTRGAISHMGHGFNSNDKLFHRKEKNRLQRMLHKLTTKLLFL